MTIGLWAFYTGAGALGGIVVAVVAGGARFGIGQLALAFVTSTWLRLVITVVYVAPAMFAGYNATHGIAQMAKAFADLANDLRDRWRDCRYPYSVHPLYGYGRTRTSRTGFGTGLPR